MWAYEDLQNLKIQLSKETKPDHATTEDEYSEEEEEEEEVEEQEIEEPFDRILAYLGIMAACLIGLDGMCIIIYYHQKYQMKKKQATQSSTNSETETVTIDLHNFESHNLNDSGHFSLDIVSLNAAILEDP